MCFGRITQRHPGTNRQDEPAIAHIIGKLTHLRWIRLRKHTRNLHCRILRRRAFWQYSGVAKGAVLLYLRDQLRGNLTAVSATASTRGNFSIASSSSIASTSETPRER